MEIALGKHLTPRVPKVGITITKSHCPWSCSCMNKGYKMEAFVLENNFTFTNFVIGNSLKTFLLCNPVSWNLHTKFKAIVDRMVTSIPKRSLCPNLWALWRFDLQRLLGFGEWETQSQLYEVRELTQVQTSWCERERNKMICVGKTTLGSLPLF